MQPLQTGWKRRALVLVTLALLACSLLATEVQRSVAEGSHFTVSSAEAGLPTFARKPCVYVGGGSLKAGFRRVRVLTAQYPAAEIECEFGAPIPAGTYQFFLSLTAEGEKRKLPGWVYVMDPYIKSTAPQWGTAGQTITLKGQYFGVSRPTVQLEFFDGPKNRVVLLECPVKAGESHMNPDTGDSTLAFKVPGKMPDSASVICLRSRSGVGKIAFGSFPFQKQDDLPIPMRDSVILKGNLYTPMGGGPYPTLVFRTPYSKDEGDQ